MQNKYKHKKGFTLMEVLIAVAITGLVVTAGFRLIAMSMRSLAEIQDERALTAAAQRLWLKFKTDKDMPESGKEKDERTGDDVEWETELDSVPVEDLELPFKRIKVTLRKRSMVFYLPQDN